MDGKPFSRTVLHPRERPLSSDLNTLQAQQDRSLRDTLLEIFAGRATPASYTRAFRTGFIGEGFKVRAKGAPGMEVEVAAGLGFMDNLAGVASSIDGVQGLDDLSRYVPTWLEATHTFTVPAAPGAGSARKDIILAKAGHKLGNPSSRDVLDPSTGIFGALPLNKTLKYAVDGETDSVGPLDSATAPLVYKRGAVATAGTETEPPVDAGYVKIATVLVGAEATQITADKIIDWRPLLFPGGCAQVGGSVVMGFGTAEGTDPWWLAPPGVDVGWVRSPDITHLAFTLYVRAGDGAHQLVNAMPSRFPSSYGTSPTAETPPDLAARIIDARKTTVDGGIQTLLHGSPLGFQVAVGQPIYQVRVAAGAYTGSGTISITTGLGAGLKDRIGAVLTLG